jgi:hypothetical protein
MPPLRPRHQRESIDGGTVELVLHHLPGADRRARVMGLAELVKWDEALQLFFIDHSEILDVRYSNEELNKINVL